MVVKHDVKSFGQKLCNFNRSFNLTRLANLQYKTLNGKIERSLKNWQSFNQFHFHHFKIQIRNSNQSEELPIIFHFRQFKFETLTNRKEIVFYQTSWIFESMTNIQIWIILESWPRVGYYQQWLFFLLLKCFIFLL